MNFLDFLIIFILITFTYKGYRLGFVYVLGEFIGTVVGAWVGRKFYESLGEILVPFFGPSPTTNIVSFGVLFLGVNQFVGFLLTIPKMIAQLPFLKQVNKIWGAGLDFIIGILIIGVFLYLAPKFDPLSWASQNIEGSLIGSPLVKLTTFLISQLPQQLRTF